MIQETIVFEQFVYLLPLGKILVRHIATFDGYLYAFKPQENEEGEMEMPVRITVGANK